MSVKSCCSPHLSWRPWVPPSPSFHRATCPRTLVPTTGAGNRPTTEQLNRANGCGPEPLESDKRELSPRKVSDHGLIATRPKRGRQIRHPMTQIPDAPIISRKGGISHLLNVAFEGSSIEQSGRRPGARTRTRANDPWARPASLRTSSEQFANPGKGSTKVRKVPRSVQSAPLHTKDGWLLSQHDRAVNAIGQTPRLHTLSPPHALPTTENG